MAKSLFVPGSRASVHHLSLHFLWEADDKALPRSGILLSARFDELPCKIQTAKFTMAYNQGKL